MLNLAATRVQDRSYVSVWPAGEQDPGTSNLNVIPGRIAANPPLAVRRLKAGLRRALDPDWDDLGRWVSATLGELFQTADHREGVAAFVEKRKPDFTGE